MDPVIHAKNCVKSFGGHIDDYLPIHEYLDFSKSLLPDHRHRLFLHNTLGIALTIKQFGSFITNSDNKRVSIRDIAEKHIIEDLGQIPTIEECAQKLDPQTDNDTSSIVLNAKNKVKRQNKKGEQEKNYYLITKKCWEYNDEFYDERGTEPIFITENLAKAEEECKRLNIEWFKTKNYTEHGSFIWGENRVFEGDGTQYTIEDVLKMVPEEIYLKVKSLHEYKIVPFKSN